MMYKKMFIFIVILLMSTLFISCTGEIDFTYDNPITTVSGSTDTQEDAFARKIDFDIDFDLTQGLVSLYRSVENGLYFIVTESRLSNTIQSAYLVLEDGTRQAIEDIEEFAIANNVVRIEVEFSPGVPLEGFELNATNYEGYYLGNSYYMQIEPIFYPENATNKKIKYFSSNTSVASVSNMGRITIKDVGTAVISVVTLEGNYKKTIHLDINDGQLI